MIETKIPVESVTDDELVVGGQTIRKTPFNGGRTTFLHRDLIIKVGYASKHEAELFPKIAYADLAYFAPVVDHGKTQRQSAWTHYCGPTPWIAQVYLKHDPYWPAEKAEYVKDKWEEMQEVLRRYNVFDVYLDKHEDSRYRTFNWAIINDKPVCYDYACWD